MKFAKDFECIFQTTLVSFFIALIFTSIVPISCTMGTIEPGKQRMLKAFLNPPDSTRPGVYWYFMDGNLSRQAMTSDLESMKKAGIGNLVFLEVNVGVPRGPVDFLSEEWQDLFQHAEKEAERLGIEITLGVGPGWSGSGGPWVRPEQSMQHLAASSVQVKGPQNYTAKLPVPDPRPPYFGERALTTELKKQWQAYYQDVFLLAFPTPAQQGEIKDSDEKALYYRAPYTSRPNVKPFLPAPAVFEETPSNTAIAKDKVLDITDHLQPDGTVNWDVPAGNWTIMRFGTRNNGAVTRPAPFPGLGFEANKFDTTDFNAHFEKYVGALLKRIGPRKKGVQAGLTMLHMDSWEMGAQNWTAGFRQSFQARRGYDPLPFLPSYVGAIVGNLELSERFLWDIRLTAQELVLENHAGHIKTLGRRHGLGLSIEPYDMNPTSDLDQGAIADVPMCEFWSKGYGFNSSFSCFEAASIAHIKGLPVVAAEAFTAGSHEAWKLYPGALKNQGDWAFCVGINRFVYHTFAHKPLADSLRPGMTMGPYGVHWDRGQTWWPLVSEYHKYISRCSFLLQQGNTVADILYLTPEGAPHVFRPPASATVGNDTIPDRRGYNFDGCSPLMLLDNASVHNHKVVFPGGASYHILVLPAFETMTPELLNKIESLIKMGATVVGPPPRKSPSLVDYPECDDKVRSKAEKMWGGWTQPQIATERTLGNGKIFWGGELDLSGSDELYPHYDATAELLSNLYVDQDFESTGPVRYTHRSTVDYEIYFVANREDKPVIADCRFRAEIGDPQLWDPLTGQVRFLPEFSRTDGLITIPLKFESHQSFFILFDKDSQINSRQNSAAKNFADLQVEEKIQDPWQVSFDPKWGGPENIAFETLEDWSARPEQGIRFYSGMAVYKNTFDNVSDPGGALFLDLGEVHCMAAVRLNEQDLGVIWTAPWRVNITDAVKEKDNVLEITVANLWANRLIGDEQFPDDGIQNGQWPEWLLKGIPRTSGRYTFTTKKYYTKESPLQKSGLIGPVNIYRIVE